MQGFEVVASGLGECPLPDILARTGYGHRMAPVRVRGCAGESEPLGTPGRSFGKPMPGAGETAHVRRLFVDRSRCALEVSPAPRRVQMSLMTGRRAVVASKSGDTLSRRMWGRRPGRPDGWHAIPRGFAFNGELSGAPPPPCAGAPLRPADAPGAPGSSSPGRASSRGTRHLPGPPGRRPRALRAAPPRGERSRGGAAHRCPAHRYLSDTAVRCSIPHQDRLVVYTAKVLFSRSGGPTNHVPVACDDRAPDGYTHFQARRDPHRSGSPAEGG